ncbi:MAG: family 10 glycosylhydrolase, partial [Candidatus Omnitrophica bacterium]|nr:family 10 glycosylhydrolase [Candidatus Omnitrophota bacterium]
VLIQEAHRQGIEVHAWFNVLSLSGNEKAYILRKYGPQVLVTNPKKKIRLQDYKVDNQYFLEPSHPNVKKELLAIVKDLVKSYPQLDGIQFDYIRYPDVDPHYGYSTQNIEEFKKVTGQKDIDESSFVWRDWKRKSVTRLLKALAAQTHLLNPKLRISAAGCMPYIRAYEEAFQDWPYWIDNGIVDFISLMNYAPEPEIFERSLHTALEKTKSFPKIMVSVGAYRFMKEEKKFQEEFNICRDMVQGCAVFHYGSLLESPELMTALTSDGQK